MKQLAVSLLLLFFCIDLASGAEDASQREAVQKGIELIYNLDYAGAQKIFDQLKKDHPESLAGYGMTALNAWNQMNFASRNLAIYDYGIPAPVGRDVPAAQSVTPEQKHFHDANQALQTFCEKRLQKNPQDPEALYFEGLSYENLATEAMTFNRAVLRARGHANKAKKFHKEALSLDPSLIDAKTSTATLEYIVDTLPWYYRALAKIFGLNGDKAGAIEKLREVADKGVYRAKDAQSVLAFLQTWDEHGDPQVSVSILSDLRKKHPRNFLLDISLAAAYMAAEDAKSAIRVYEELLDNIPSKAPGVHPGEIHLRIANCLVQLRDYSLALDQFQKALDTEQGDSETQPLVYYNMALIYEERGEKKLAKECYRHVVDYSGPTVLIEKELKRAKKKIR